MAERRAPARRAQRLLHRVWTATMVTAALTALAAAEIGFADWGPRFR